MIRNSSIQTIESPEFINLAPDAINPNVSQCEIKVLYLGKNRNGSYIDRAAAEGMAETLPGTPIVGAYHKDIDDFGDHGNIIHIENGEISFSCATVPYGFVAPDAKVWFQNFIDTDEFDNKIERTYLMTTGYLWVGQYPEIERCLSEGMGQSMELDDMDGHWATDSSQDIDFFIINDATFTKLCVLGNKVEPCFEGAAVTAPTISANFSKENFTTTLFSMMEDLKNMTHEGGLKMNLEKESEQVEETPVVEEIEPQTEEPVVEESVTEEPVVEPESEENLSEEDFAKKKKDEEDKEEEDKKEESDGEENEETTDEEDEDDKKKKKSQHSVESEISVEEVEQLRNQVAEFQATINQMNEELAGLREFKLARDNADKDALIAKYFMLSDEDKAEISANKEQFSLAEIESQLALLYVQKNNIFELDSNESNQEVVTTFSLNNVNSPSAVIDPLQAAIDEALNK